MRIARIVAAGLAALALAFTGAIVAAQSASADSATVTTITHDF